MSNLGIGVRFVGLSVTCMFALIGVATPAKAGCESTLLGGAMATKEEVIRKLRLEPLPGEGGYYRETYRSPLRTSARNVGIMAEGQRSLGTAIYYLVGEQEFSALHRLKGDEIFHFYSGDPVEMVQISPDGRLKRITMGPDIMNGHQVQVVVPAGTWQGTRLCRGGRWALLGTTMAPGFEFTDFELGNREALLSQYPELSNDIVEFTR
jgi:hypothetical protein